MKANFSIAIDGPVGVGKGTLAEALAQKLEATYIYTGGMYRALTLAATREGMDLREGLLKFLDFAEDTILVAHNLPFDWMHVQNALEKHGFQPTYFYKGLDTFSLGWLLLGDKAEFPRLSLKELSNHFGINMGTHHRAIDDARSAYMIFMELVKLYEEK